MSRRSLEGRTGSGRRARSRGIALLVVLVLLLVMGLTTGMAMRSAVTTQKVGAALRLDSVAQQAAEAALRACEDEIDKPPGQGAPELANLDTLPAQPVDQLRWSQFSWWAPTPPQADQVVRYVPPNVVPPGTPNPECLVERMSLSTNQPAIVVTVRGFSPGYTFDPSTGQTLSGQVVWLQSFLYYE